MNTMNDINDILDCAVLRMPEGQQYDKYLAPAIGLKSSVTKIRKHHDFLNIHHCIALSKIVDMEIMAVYAISEAGRDASKEVHKFWESTAKMAMHAAVAALLLSGVVSGAGDFGLLNDSAQLANFDVRTMDIM